jgi:lactoylglutathione lyase
MRTLHFGLRVTDLERSLAFYTGVGYKVVGDVPETPLGHLTMLKLPGDEFVTIDPDGNRIELVQWPPGHPDGLGVADWAE